MRRSERWALERSSTSRFVIRYPKKLPFDNMDTGLTDVRDPYFLGRDSCTVARSHPAVFDHHPGYHDRNPNPLQTSLRPDFR